MNMVTGRFWNFNLKLVNINSFNLINLSKTSFDFNILVLFSIFFSSSFETTLTSYALSKKRNKATTPLSSWLFNFGVISSNI